MAFLLKLKKRLKAMLPACISQRLQQRRVNRRSKRLFKDLSPGEVFSKVYKEGLWLEDGQAYQPFFSGPGSHDEEMRSVYIQAVSQLLERFAHKPDVVDLGCGDFAIGSQIRPLCGNYIACDIVPELISHNKSKWSNLEVDFRVLDLITDPLPAADIVFIRQVLQHLSNNHIQQLIPKLKPNYKLLILTEHIPDSKNFTPNLDKPTAGNIRLDFDSGVVLTAPPFNLQPLKEEVICEVKEYRGLIRTTLYKLN